MKSLHSNTTKGAFGYIMGMRLEGIGMRVNGNENEMETQEV